MPAPTDHSPEAENAVIGGLLLDNRALYDIEALRAEHFASPFHARAFATISAMVGAGDVADVVTVADRMKGDGTLERLGRMAQGAPSARIAPHAKIVVDKARRRRVLSVLDEAREKAMTAPVDEVVAAAQSQLESVSHDGMGSEQGFPSILRAALLAVEDAGKRRHHGVIGSPTGLPEVDKRTGGLHGERLWVVAARPSLGKSALALQWCLHGAKRGFRSGICSLEMPYHELGTRAFANLLQINGTALAFADPGVVEFVKSKIPSMDAELPVWGDDQTYSLGGIVSRITEWKRKHDINFAVVDHIGLVETTGYTSRNDQLGAVTRELKKLTKRLGIPIIAVSQLNRDVTKNKRRPELSDLRDSGNIEQDADVALFIHAHEDDELEQEVPVELGLLKNRGGKKGWLPAKYLFNGREQRFTEQISMNRVA